MARFIVALWIWLWHRYICAFFGSFFFSSFFSAAAFSLVLYNGIRLFYSFTCVLCIFFLVRFFGVVANSCERNEAVRTPLSVALTHFEKIVFFTLGRPSRADEMEMEKMQRESEQCLANRILIACAIKPIAYYFKLLLSFFALARFISWVLRHFFLSRRLVRTLPALSDLLFHFNEFFMTRRIRSSSIGSNMFFYFACPPIFLDLLMFNFFFASLFSFISILLNAITFW